MAAAEAQACATPVVALRRGAFGEVIADGVTGFLVPPDDISAAAHAVAKTAGISRSACRDHAEGHLDLTEAIAVEGKEHGISAICISPGAVDTQMLRQANPALRPGLTPDDVAVLILALLDSPLAPASGANIPLFSNA
jgi:NAD(P)-dependent dehydrogenase (short-subunit alcohol dehydrogenase family)